MANKVLFEIEVDANFKELIALQTQMDKVQKEQKELTKAGQKNTGTYQQNRQELKRLNDEYKHTEKQLNSNKRSTKALGTSYNDLTNHNKRLSAELRKIQNPLGKDKKLFDQLSASMHRNEQNLKKMDAAMGRNQRHVGDYGRGLKGLGKSFVSSGAAALGLVGGMQLIASGVKNALKIIKDFEQSNANLAAVLGKSTDEIKKLADDAKRLGSITAFTASEVSGLQTEFAKLGFNESEILGATEATLNLAAATGTELSEAAAVAGATMGGFGLSALETQRITDVMAKSFSSSALDMEKFKESMKTAAPAAKAVGVDIERTTALLGTMANAGISGSKAGNALKNSFINLNKAGLTLEQGLSKVNGSSNKLKTAVELVGKEAATSFLILADGTETTNDLEIALNDAGGAAEEMAKTQLNTLEGSMTKLTSTWEGFIHSLNGSESVIGNTARTLVDQLGGAIVQVQNLGTTWSIMTKDLKELSTTELDALIQYFTVESGKNIKDVIDSTFEHLTDKQLFVDSNIFDGIGKTGVAVDRYKEKLVNAFVEQGESIEDATILVEHYFTTQIEKYKGLNEETKENTVVTDENTESKGKNAKSVRALTGLIEKQAKVVSDLNKAIKRATDEESIISLRFDLENAKKELKRLEALGKKEDVTLEIEVEPVLDIKKWNDKIDSEKKKTDFPTIEVEAEATGLSEESKELLKSSAINLAQQTSDAVFNIQKQNVDRQKDYALDQLKIQDTLERDMLESRLESGAISQEEYENNRQALAERTAEKQLAIEKKAFEKQKKLSTAQALINGALAVTKIMAEYPKGDYGVATAIGIAAAVAATGVEVATIQSQQFADGGLLQGASHDQGGIPFTIGGRAGFEAEGGEFMVNREATAKNLPLLQALNNETLRKPNYSGYNRAFANGGLVSQGINSQDLQNQASAIAEQLQTLRVINVASETQAVNDNAIRIENEYTL